MESEYLSPRFALPMLAAGQAQKEITHNEALALLDGIVHPVLISASETAPPIGPAPGEAWIVGANASGAWSGQDGAIALMTAGGWRFIAPIQGMQAWLAGGRATFVDGAWSAPPAYAAPGGGGTIDAEARNALSTISAALAMAGLIITN